MIWLHLSRLWTALAVFITVEPSVLLGATIPTELGTEVLQRETTQASSAAGPGDLVTLWPLLTAAQPTRGPSVAEQLFYEDLSVPAYQARQVPTPPPPTGTTDTTASTPSSSSSLLNALLPLLAFSALEGGFSGEGAFLLPLLMSGLGQTPFGGLGPFNGLGGALPSLAGPPFLWRTPTPPAANRIQPFGLGNSKPNPGSSADGPVAAALNLCSFGSSICDEPFDKILSFDDYILAIKGEKLYILRPDGVPVDYQPSPLNPALRNVTAAATLRGVNYIFQGNRYHKYKNGLKGAASASQSQSVAAGFPGVPSPVDAVFQLNNATFVIVSGSQFVFYQPEANPPVNPRYSPQSLQSIPGAPAKVDSVFFIHQRPILYHRGILYELEPGKMQIRQKRPLTNLKGDGWIKCPINKCGLANAVLEDVGHVTKMNNQSLTNKKSNSP